MKCRVAEGCIWHGKIEGTVVEVSRWERFGWEHVLLLVDEPKPTHDEVPETNDRAMPKSKVARRKGTR